MFPWLYFRYISWFENFIKHSEANKNSKVLLILDRHASHTKSVILFCSPAHCTHRLQLLDLVFRKPLNTYYDHVLRKWLREHPGRVVTQFQIASIFGTAYLESATMTNAINGFRKSGIWTVDRSVFTVVNFLTTEATYISLDVTIATTCSFDAMTCINYELNFLATAISYASSISSFSTIPNSSTSLNNSISTLVCSTPQHSVSSFNVLTLW